MKKSRNFLAIVFVLIFSISNQLIAQDSTIGSGSDPSPCDTTVGRFDTIFGVTVLYCRGSGNVSCRPACPS